MASEANKKLKLCKRQARRVYEILRLHYVQKLFSRTFLENLERAVQLVTKLDDSIEEISLKLQTKIHSACLKSL